MAAKYPLKKGQKVSEPQFAQWQIEVLIWQPQIHN